MKTTMTAKTMIMALGLAALLAAPALAFRGADRAAQEKHLMNPVESRLTVPFHGPPQIQRVVLMNPAAEAVGETERIHPPYLAPHATDEESGTLPHPGEPWNMHPGGR